MEPFLNLLVLANLPVLVGVLVAALFGRIGSGAVGVIIGLIFGLAAFAGMTIYGMEHVTPLLGGGAA